MTESANDRAPKLTAEMSLEISPSEFVPSKGRVEWLARFGTPTAATVRFVGRLADWHAAKVPIDELGELPPPTGGNFPSSLHHALRDHAANLARETGAVPELIDEQATGQIIAALVARLEREKHEQAARDRETAERIRLRDEQERAEREAKKVAHAESLAAWMAWGLVNGSADLQYAIREGYPCEHLLEKELERALVPPVDGAEVDLDIPRTVHFDGLRATPNAESRDLLARIAAAVEAASSRAPAGTTVKLGKIERCHFLMQAPDGCRTDEIDADGDVMIKATGAQVTICAEHVDIESCYVWGRSDRS